MKKKLLTFLMRFRIQSPWAAALRRLLWGSAALILLLAPLRGCRLLSKLGLAGAFLLCAGWLRPGPHFRRACLAACAALLLLLLFFAWSRPDLGAAGSVCILLLLAMEESRSRLPCGTAPARLFAAAVFLTEALAGLQCLFSVRRGTYSLLASWYALALCGALLVSCGRSFTRKEKEHDNADRSGI